MPELARGFIGYLAQTQEPIGVESGGRGDDLDRAIGLGHDQTDARPWAFGRFARQVDRLRIACGGDPIGRAWLKFVVLSGGFCPRTSAFGSSAARAAPSPRGCDAAAASSVDCGSASAWAASGSSSPPANCAVEMDVPGVAQS